MSQAAINHMNFAIIVLIWLSLQAFATDSDLPKMLPVSGERRIIFATVGTPHLLRCPVIKHHVTFIEWSKGPKDLYNKDSEGYTVTENGILKIRNVSMTSSGIYTCNATNGHGSISVKVQLIVSDPKKPDDEKIVNHISVKTDMSSGLSPPKMESSLVREFKEESGGSAVLHCTSTGYPAPLIIWMKNGHLMEGFGIETKQSRSRTWSSLVIQKLRKSDSGTYRCIAKNKVGRDHMDYNLHVIDPHYPPEIASVTPPNSTVTSGHIVIFRCKGRSVPFLKLYIKWLKTIPKDEMRQSNRTFYLGSNYYKVLDTDEDPIIANTGRFQSELLLQNVTVQDSGIYVCLAVNDQGYRYKNVSLKVILSTKTIPTSHFSSPNPSFVIFIIFSTIVITAPVAFLLFLCCRCIMTSNSHVIELTPQVERLKQDEQNHRSFKSEYKANPCNNCDNSMLKLFSKHSIKEFESSPSLPKSSYTTVGV